MDERAEAASHGGRRALAWLGFLVLMALHFVRPEGDGLLLGWLPVEMAYRLLWIGLAWAYLAFFTTWIWGAGEEG